ESQRREVAVQTRSQEQSSPRRRPETRRGDALRFTTGGDRGRPTRGGAPSRAGGTGCGDRAGGAERNGGGGEDPPGARRDLHSERSCEGRGQIPVLHSPLDAPDGAEAVIARPDKSTRARESRQVRHLRRESGRWGTCWREKRRARPRTRSRPFSFS